MLVLMHLVYAAASYPFGVLSDHINRRLQFVIFFNDTATTEIYTLSLHDALPISFPSLRRTTHPISRRLQFIFFRRLRAHQIPHEIVPPPPHHIRLTAEPVVAVGQQQQIEILVSLY